MQGPMTTSCVDLASSADTHAAIAQMKERLKAQGSKLHALVNNAAISPKKPGGGRLNTIETRGGGLEDGVPDQFLRARSCWRAG